MLYKLWTPALVFSAHDSETKLIEAKIKSTEMINKFSCIPMLVLENAGVPSMVKETISWLIAYCADVQDARNRLIEAKIDEVAVTSAISLYEANIRVIQGRLKRLLSDISKEEKKLEVVPAFSTCQEILTLFRDPKYPFWCKPEISSPLLVSFAQIYISVGLMTVALIETYRADVGKEMEFLGDLVDNYKLRYLCFRLEAVKCRLLSRNLIDKYDDRNRTTARNIVKKHFDHSCLYEQAYSIALSKVYGNFFDSVKAAILESKLLPPGVFPKNECCIEHNRCYSAYKMQKDCFCKRLDPRDTVYLSVKESYLQKKIEANQCLLTVSSTDSYVRHYQYVCRTCDTSGNGRKGVESICRSCILVCHKGHDVEFSEFGWFNCHCAKNSPECKLQETENVDSRKQNNDKVTKAKTVTENVGDWPFVSCDECDENVAGDRYKCQKCFDYDLCGQCINDEVHTRHNFVYLLKTSDGVKSSDVHRFEFCSKCKKEPLRGSFFKCTQCKNYKLCSQRCRDEGSGHKHDTFIEISDGTKYHRTESECEDFLNKQRGRAPQYTETGEESTDEEESEEEMVDKSEEEYDERRVRTIFVKSPSMPFAKTFRLGRNTIYYEININGRIPSNPNRFAITIKLKNKIVLFINPRWDEGRTVFNSMDERGWHDEESNFFSTLYPTCEFAIKILFTDNGYEIVVNDEKSVYFAHRVMYLFYLSSELQLELSGDVIPQLVTCDLYNHS